MPSLFCEWVRWWDSPYLNRFLQPDTIIPSLADPQSWNRYSYVKNSPINYADPSGHAQTCGDQYEQCGRTPPPPADSGNNGGGGGGNPDEELGGGGDDCDNGDICVDVTTEDLICDYLAIDCPSVSRGLALAGTGLDGISFAINAPFGAAALASLLVALLGDPVGLAAYGTVVTAYQFVAPVSTAFGWAGFAAWALQGLVTGENQLGVSMITASDGSLKEISVSGSIAQDTLFSGLNDTLALFIREPIVATIWSGAGAAYDLARNPFDPTSPLLPTGVQPNGSISYNFQTASFSLNGSLFPPTP